MADVFGTPAEQIILQGTQLLQSAFRARSQIQLEREKFEEEKKHNADVLKLQQEKLDLEREVEAAKAKAEAGKEGKPLDSAMQKALRNNTFRQVALEQEGTLKLMGLGEIRAYDTEDLLQEQIDMYTRRIADALADERLRRMPAERDQVIARWEAKLAPFEAKRAYLAKEVSTRLGSSTYARTYSGEEVQAMDIKPPGGAPMTQWAQAGQPIDPNVLALEKTKVQELFDAAPRDDQGYRTLTPELRKQAYNTLRPLKLNRQKDAFDEIAVMLRGTPRSEGLSPEDMTILMDAILNTSDVEAISAGEAERATERKKAAPKTTPKRGQMK